MALPAASGPAVSVIIPTYNRASLVATCIASLRAADVASLEIIVVDDGGTDDTGRVAAEGGALYRRQANAGPAAARNLGFEASHGRYVAFIDSDDEWVREGAGRMVNQLDANPDVQVLFADTSMGNEQDGYVSFVQTYGTERFFELPHVSRDGVRVLDRRPLFLQLATRNVMFLGSMLIRREFFASIGGFDPALRGAADWDFFMRATAAGVVAYSEGPPVSRYFKHDEGMSTNSDHMEEDFIKALDSVRRRADLDAVERAHVEERLRAHVFGWAWLAFQKDDLETMRRRLRWARQLGQFGSRERAYFALSYLPPALVRVLRQLRHGVAGQS